ncbi:hypothetical protein [Erythrobacter sp. R86502]|uniref:hypothetical protein n=1 Tax=Erythrobacter sp. R86502 TaxID=3093846 RepID=UPI0036D2C7FE
MALIFRAAGLAGALVGTTILAAPVVAAPVPAVPLVAATPFAGWDFSRYNSVNSTADWRRCRWNCGWGGHRGWRRNRVGAGDVLLGAAIIGGVAAIISSNNRRERDRDVVVVDRRVRAPDWRDDSRRYDDRRFDDRRASSTGTGSSGLDAAVNQCLERIERDVRVDTVDSVDRTGAGWQVGGVLFNGVPFQCRIGNSGQIDTIDYGDGFADVGYSAVQDRGEPLPRGAGQWDDQRYTAARTAVGGEVRPDIAVQEARMQVVRSDEAPPATSAMPAYPGGPIPGEPIPETIDNRL